MIKELEKQLREEKRLSHKRSDYSKSISPCTKESVKDFNDEIMFMCGVSKALELLLEVKFDDLIKRVNNKLSAKKSDSILTEEQEQDIYLMICHNVDNEEIVELLSYVDEEI